MNQTFRSDRCSVHVVPLDPSRMTVSYLARRMKDLETARLETDSLLQKMRSTVGSTALYRAMPPQDAIQILTTQIDQAVQVVPYEPGLPLRENSVLNVLREAYPRPLSYAVIARRAFGGDVPARNLSSSVKNIKAAGWAISCVHGFGYQMDAMERGEPRRRMEGSMDLRHLARPLPEGVGAYETDAIMADDAQLIGMLSDGQGISRHVAHLPEDRQIDVLCRIQDYLTCETSRQNRESRAISKAVRALTLAYPMTVAADAIVGLIYDDVGTDLAVSRLNLNASMKRVRRAGYRVGTVMKRGFCLLDYACLEVPQPAQMIS